MKHAIRVQDLSKQFRLGSRGGDSYRTLRESLMNALRSPFRRPVAGPNDDRTHFWALKNVGFEVNPGEVVGIVGRNGAGKSTLLKILSRVTEPTTGRVELRGRVGSLLEVGTGFHLELTGRENIFLNGSILGMSRREIVRRFDEIVAFAELEKFLDTPVKRYSSGMYVRLAFSIAAHLEPEILIVDEVLAVGDASFQRKCIGKTQEVARGGRTILLVSHQMDVVRRLATKALLLKQGQLICSGDPVEVLNRYLAEGAGRILPGIAVDAHRLPRGGNLEAIFAEVTCTSDDTPSGLLHSGGSLRVETVAEARRPVRFNSLSVCLLDRNGTRLISADTFAPDREARLLEPGRHQLAVRLPHVPLRPGVYVLGLCLAQRPLVFFDNCEAIGEIEVLPGTGQEDQPRPLLDGPVSCDVEWLE
jgi:lipopolysaccharide transport system ATP-binding protein